MLEQRQSLAATKLKELADASGGTAATVADAVKFIS